MSTVQKIVLTALMVATAFVTAELMKMISFLRMPNGGSVSLSMLPLFLLAYATNTKYGLLGGFIYGVINFMFDGYAFHWASFFLDYLLAFSVLGLVGLVAKQVRKGHLWAFFGSMLVAVIFRTIFSTLSGMLAWDASFIDSLVYNASYCFPSLILCAIVGYFIKDTYFNAIKRQEKRSEN